MQHRGEVPCGGLVVIVGQVVHARAGGGPADVAYRLAGEYRLLAARADVAQLHAGVGVHLHALVKLHQHQIAAVRRHLKLAALGQVLAHAGVHRECICARFAVRHEYPVGRPVHAAHAEGALQALLILQQAGRIAKGHGGVPARQLGLIHAAHQVKAAVRGEVEAVGIAAHIVGQRHERAARQRVVVQQVLRIGHLQEGHGVAVRAETRVRYGAELYVQQALALARLVVEPQLAVVVAVAGGGLAREQRPLHVGHPAQYAAVAGPQPGRGLALKRTVDLRRAEGGALGRVAQRGGLVAAQLHHRARNARQRLLKPLLQALRIGLRLHARAVALRYERHARAVRA